MISKEDAGYKMAAGSRKCADCSMYRGGACSYVRGPISPGGWCKYWVAKSTAKVKGK